MYCGGVYKEFSVVILIWFFSLLSRVLYGFEIEMFCGYLLWFVKLVFNKIIKF